MIHLEKLTYENFDDVFDLEIKKEQYPFVADNCYSVAEAYVTLINGGKVFPFAVYNDDTLVGFIQLAYGETADQDGVSVEKDNASMVTKKSIYLFLLLFYKVLWYNHNYDRSY